MLIFKLNIKRVLRLQHVAEIKRGLSRRENKEALMAWINGSQTRGQDPSMGRKMNPMGSEMTRYEREGDVNPATRK